MKLMGILLREGRKEDLKKKYANKFDNEVLDFVLGISDLQDFNHKYTDFILKALEPETDIDYWVEIAIGLVKDFDKYQSQLKKKDINQYNTFSELEYALTPFIEKEKEKELEKQADKIYEDDKFLVVKPKTEEASCKYGFNTKWCVSSHSSGHFGRYTSGLQGLYFIINKTNSTNRNYSKVAIHFDQQGYARYWDSQDSSMSQREIDIINYAFPEIIEAIKNDYKISAGSRTDKILTETFNKVGENSAESRNYLNSDYNLTTYIRGFQNIPDLGFGHSEARLSISLNPFKNGRTDDKLIDEYQVFITYKSKDEKTFTASIGFMGPDEVSGDDFVDLDLEAWGIDVTYDIGRSPAETADGVRRHIATRVLDHIVNNPKLTQKIAGTKVWRPNKNYGYTFGKNKGFIKKLVDYLDAGTVGTKLDFLESLGKLKTKVVDGKKLYSRSEDNYVPSSQFRGQFASFFASAKMAGILNYRKVGKNFFLVKGPNFEAFKSGELKAF
jgi:hypothetical protein